MKELPKGWEWKKLGEMCEIYNGSTPSRNKKEFWDGDILWATPTDVSNLCAKYIEDTKEKITREGYESCSTHLLPKGSVIFTSRASIGHIAITKIQLCTNQGFKNFVCKKELLPEFLFYCLKMKKKEIENLSSGSTFKEVSMSVIKQVEIQVPPLPTQKQIVSILERAENLKEQRKLANEETNKIVQSLFYEIFGDLTNNERGFEIFSGNQIFILSSGKFNPTKNLDSSYPYPTYGGNGITGRSKDYLIDFDTIVIGRVGVYCGSVYKTRGKIWITDNAIYLKKLLRDVNLLYLLYFFKTQNLNKFATRSGQPKITQKPLENMKIPIPSIALQNQFASIVEKVESLKEKQEQSTEEINVLFDGLMQKVFSSTLVARNE